MVTSGFDDAVTDAIRPAVKLVKLALRGVPHRGTDGTTLRSLNVAA